MKGTPPNPPQWGNKLNSSPPWRGAVLRRRGCLYLFFSSFLTLSILFRIDPHAAFTAPVEDENKDSAYHGMQLS